MKGLSLLILFTCFNASSTGFAQSSLPKQDADSLWAVWSDESQPDTSRAKAMNDYIRDGYLNSQPDSAIYFAELLHHFAIEKELKNEIANALHLLGFGHMNQGDYPKALNYNQQSLKMREELKNKSGVAYSLTSIGIIYIDQGDYSQALNYLQHGLEIYKEIGNKQEIATCFSNIGVFYERQHDYSQALVFYQKSFEIFEEISDLDGLSTSINNIGGTYLLAWRLYSCVRIF